MCWYRPWYQWFMYRRRRRPYWRRRRFWRPRPFFWGPGCGCLPLTIVLGLLLFMCLLSMCSGSCYYWY